MVELVDTRDLKSLGTLLLSEFKSRSRHRKTLERLRVFLLPVNWSNEFNDSQITTILGHGFLGHADPDSQSTHQLVDLVPYR